MQALMSPPMRLRAVQVLALNTLIALGITVFEAVDYLLKPVQAARLLKTVQKVQFAHMQRAQSAINSDAGTEQTLNQLSLHGNADKLAVSRLYSHLFRAMLRAPINSAPHHHDPARKHFRIL